MQIATVDRTKEWTIEDYNQLGEEYVYQLINGELIMSPSPGLTHQRVSKNVERIFDAYTERNGGEFFHAPFDVYLDSRNVLQPDVILLAAGTTSAQVTEKGVEGAPDLVVEILSPSNSHIDRYHKREIYRQFGVKEYWMIDPKNQTIEVLNFLLDSNEPVLYLAEEGMVSSSVFPGLNFELSTVF